MTGSMAGTLTDNELTVLSLLSEMPRHGYELEKVVEERGVRNWTALGFSSIYYLLDKLARRGLIEPVGAGGTGRSRTTFRATSAGLELCRTTALDALASIEPLHARVLVALASSSGLPEADVAAGLARRARALSRQLENVRATRARQEPLLAAASAIFDYSETMLAADLLWTETTANAFRKGSDMEKFDVKVVHKSLYSPSSTEFTIVDVPAINYLAIDGHGDPNTSPVYAEALEALYSVGYVMKFENKKVHGRDTAVGPLEGLWRADELTAFTTGDKNSWDWTMMIAQPDWVTSDMLDAAVAKVARKKTLDALDGLRLFVLEEGCSVQILHHGSYDDEAPTLDQLHHEYLPEQGLTFNGDHHEIYLNDARRTDPARLKTILRQPVRAC